MKNKKGFTLVELLAVIVVLAIIMIIAVPAVLDSMSSAKKGSFVVEARNVIRKGIEKYQADTLTSTQKKCYTVAELKIETGGKYSGKVVLEKKSGESAEDWHVYLTDKEYVVNGVTSAGLNTDSNITTGTTVSSTCS